MIAVRYDLVRVWLTADVEGFQELVPFFSAIVGVERLVRGGRGLCARAAEKGAEKEAAVRVAHGGPGTGPGSGFLLFSTCGWRVCVRVVARRPYVLKGRGEGDRKASSARMLSPWQRREPMPLKVVAGSPCVASCFHLEVRLRLCPLLRPVTAQRDDAAIYGTTASVMDVLLSELR